MTVNENNQQREPWPGRYFVEAEVTTFQYEGSLYNVSMTISHVYMSDEEITDLIEELGYARNSRLEIGIEKETMIYDTFSEKEADILVEYLNSLDGWQTSKREAHKPDHGELGQYLIFSCLEAIEAKEKGDCGHKAIVFWGDGWPLSFSVKCYFYAGKSNKITLSPEAMLEKTVNKVKSLSTANQYKILQKMLDLFEDDVV